MLLHLSSALAGLSVTLRMSACACTTLLAGAISAPCVSMDGLSAMNHVGPSALALHRCRSVEPLHKHFTYA